MKTNALVLTESGLVIALSVILSFLPFWRMPQGGSITLECVPIVILAWIRGWKTGIMSGILSGILQMILGGYIIHPVQAMLDYPLAFGILGVAGFFGNNIFYASLSAMTGKFLMHLLSGVIFFASYAPTGMNPWLYSAIYNGSYLVPDAIILLLIMLGLKRRLDLW